MSDLPRRGIIHEHEFEEQLARLIPNAEEADDYIAGAQTLLAGDPESGMPCEPGGKTFYLTMSPVRNRRVSLFYTFDENWVVFLAILPFDD
jgi:hypothetical protein